MFLEQSHVSVTKFNEILHKFFDFFFSIKHFKLKFQQIKNNYIKLRTATEWAPVSVIPAVQLFLAAMYASHPPASDTGIYI